MIGPVLVATFSVVCGWIVASLRAARLVRDERAIVEGWLSLGIRPTFALRLADQKAVRVFGGLAALSALAWVMVWRDGSAFLWIAPIGLLVGGHCGRLMASRRLLRNGRLPDELPLEAHAAFREDSVPKRPVRGRDH